MRPQKITEQQLTDLYLAKIPLVDIAKAYNMTRNAVVQRLNKLGLVERRPHKRLKVFFKPGLHVTSWWISEIAVDFIKQELDGGRQNNP